MMGKKPLLISLIIIGVIIAGAAYLFTSAGTKDAKQQMIDTDETQQTEQTTTSGGAYINYKDGVITNTSGTKLLFFHAAWCPQCRELEADIKKSGVPEGVTIIKVDYDTNQPLRQKYGVTLQTTLVKVDDNGELIKKFVAYDDPSLDAVKKNLL
jgi:thiol-disulfide isomerase/thioredoxin